MDVLEILFCLSQLSRLFVLKQKFVHHPSKICFSGFEWMMDKSTRICIFYDYGYNYQEDQTMKR